MEQRTHSDLRADAAEPRVRRAVARSVQGALIERGVWSDVRKRMLEIAPDALRELDASEPSEWMTVAGHIALIDAACDVCGVEGMRALGRDRILGLATGAFFPSIVGSWTRTFQTARDIVQIFPHLWRASGQNTGELVTQEIGETRAVFRFEHLHPSVAGCLGWRSTIEGMATGLFERVKLECEAQATPMPDGTAVEFTVSWKP